MSTSALETIKAKAGKNKAVSYEIRAIIEDYRAEIVCGALCVLAAGSRALGRRVLQHPVAGSNQADQGGRDRAEAPGLAGGPGASPVSGLSERGCEAVAAALKGLTGRGAV